MRKITQTSIDARTRYYAKREYVNNYKLGKGCEICGYNENPLGLQLDHIDPSSKYRDKNGNLVSPSTMVSRYPLATIIAELEKCRVVCAICHIIYTHTEQRVKVDSWSS